MRPHWARGAALRCVLVVGKLVAASDAARVGVLDAAEARQAEGLLRQEAWPWPSTSSSEAERVAPQEEALGSRAPGPASGYLDRAWRLAQRTYDRMRSSLPVFTQSAPPATTETVAVANDSDVVEDGRIAHADFPGPIMCYGLEMARGELRFATTAGVELFAVRPVNCTAVYQRAEMPDIVRHSIGVPVLLALARDEAGACVFRSHGATLTFTGSQGLGLLVLRVALGPPGQEEGEPFLFRLGFSEYGPCTCSDLRRAADSAATTFLAWMGATMGELVALHYFIEGLAAPEGGERGRRFQRLAVDFRQALASGHADGFAIERVAGDFSATMAGISRGGASAASDIVGALRAASLASRELCDPAMQGKLDLEEGVRLMAPIAAAAA